MLENEIAAATTRYVTALKRSTRRHEEWRAVTKPLIEATLQAASSSLAPLTGTVRASLRSSAVDGVCLQIHEDRYPKEFLSVMGALDDSGPLMMYSISPRGDISVTIQLAGKDFTSSPVYAFAADINPFDVTERLIFGHVFKLMELLSMFEETPPKAENGVVSWSISVRPAAP